MQNYIRYNTAPLPAPHTQKHARLEGLKGFKLPAIYILHAFTFFLKTKSLL